MGMINGIQQNNFRGRQVILWKRNTGMAGHFTFAKSAKTYAK